MKRRFAVVLALLPLVPCVTLSAQSADTLPFRAGQWGAEFVAGGGFSGAGVLRFLSPSRALLLEGVANRSNLTTTGQLPDRVFTSLQFRLGHRWYRPARSGVVKSLTVGLSGARSTERRDDAAAFPASEAVSLTRTSGGAFAELGAAWMVAPQLALGASWGGALQYLNSAMRYRTALNPSVLVEQTDTQLVANIGQLGLRVSLFF